MAARSQCGVVIPSYNGAHFLGPCLEVLASSPPTCETKVVIVDDGSSDGTIERFRGHRAGVELLDRGSNDGFAHACNDGAEAVGKVDYLVFLNNDTVPLGGWLDALVEEAEAHPEAAAFGSKLLYPDGTIQHAGIAIGQDLWPHHIYAGFPGDHPAVSRSKRVVASSAACLLVRREAFERLGGFDTAYVNGYEDIDLCLSLGEQGFETRYCAKSSLYHLESVTRWSDWNERQVDGNAQLLADRWRDKLTADDVDYYLADGLISVEYGDIYPVRMSVSPLLAAVHRDTGDEDPLEALLSIRTGQVQQLQAKRTRDLLEYRRDEIDLVAPTVAVPAERERPEQVSAGQIHRLGGARPSRLVSVLMPVRNAAADLRESLPLLFEQRAGVEVELVAVDSGSSDETVAVLEEHGAKVLAIDPADFDHGLTRNLAAEHARGEVLVFLNARSRPVDDQWLAPLLHALDSDPEVAGACSRVVSHPDADILTRRDVGLDPSGSAARSVKSIGDWGAYRAMPVEERRLLLNFHTVSAAIRADVMKRIPFRSVRTIGEDLLWSREVLESGLTLMHEPLSRVYHSHDYSLREWFMRNVDDGVANHDINGRSLSEEETEALVRGMIMSDWQYLHELLGIDDEELVSLRITAAMRRAAQGVGQWLGANYGDQPPEVVAAFSRIANIRRIRA